MMRALEKSGKKGCAADAGERPAAARAAGQRPAAAGQPHAAACAATSPHAAGRLLLAIACACLLALPVSLAFPAPAPAWAADDQQAEGDNAVNPQQLPDSSFIYDTSIADLSSADTYYDEQTVQVTGEVIGDWIKGDTDDDRHCWITLAAMESAVTDGTQSDDNSTIIGGATSAAEKAEKNASGATNSSANTAATVAVYMSNESAAKIDSYGKYNETGSTLQVRGTYHLACPDHEGASDLHADVVTVVQAGKSTPDSFDVKEFLPGIILVALGLLLTVVYSFVRERQR